MFRKYFNFSALVDLAKKLFETKDKKKNSELVEEIKNWKNETEKMSKEEIKNEKPNDVSEIINEILDFNKEI